MVQSRRSFLFRLNAAILGASLLWSCSDREPIPSESGGAVAGGDIVMEVVAEENEDPFEAGKAAGTALLKKMGAAAPQVVLLAECFEDREAKSRLLAGIGAACPDALICGGSTYGSFGQEGCLDLDAVSLLGIGGSGIHVETALDEKLDIAGLTMEDDGETLSTRLRAAGTRLVESLSRGPSDRLLILIPDAHSPKNQFLVEGAQSVVGRDFPITGGSANKNAGQTFVYYGGKMYQDSAVAILLSGDFQVALAGRQAKENAKVISSARDGAAEVMGKTQGKPVAVLAFNCAGRMGKLDNIEDELAALQEVLGKDLPLFGCYCAGEIGPADLSTSSPDVLSSGVGWHVMITLVSRQ